MRPVVIAFGIVVALAVAWWFLSARAEGAGIITAPPIDNATPPVWTSPIWEPPPVKPTAARDVGVIKRPTTDIDRAGFWAATGRPVIR